MQDVEFHREARLEALEAMTWYTERSLRLGDRFLESMRAAVAEIGKTPLRHRKYLAGTRRAHLSGFPYMLVYVAKTKGGVVVVAVAHTSRRPGYWRSRL